MTFDPRSLVLYPDQPGVYLMKDTNGHLLYVGKAGNLKRRVSSYFARPHNERLEKMVSEIKKIDYIVTDTALEALILEASLIKKHTPPYNIKEKDDRSFLYIEITNEKFQRVMLVRGKSTSAGKRFGPFTSAGSLRDALRIIRRIFPFNVHSPETIGKFKKPCFDYELGLCPGTCIGTINEKDYKKNIHNIALLLEGKKKSILKLLARRMKSESVKLNFEAAQKLKRQMFSLQHIEDIALIGKNEGAETITQQYQRIEGYDISNISGDAAVGSMVVFINGKPDKESYRKFKIQTVLGANDTEMLHEVLERRLHNPWPFPDLILVDGGINQVNVARRTLAKSNIKIPVIGMIKGPDRKETRLVGSSLGMIDRNTLIQVRDEAHRFAINYHKKLRSARFIKPKK